MDLDNVTIGQARELAALFGSGRPKAPSDAVGKLCIVRTDRAGVHFGCVASHDGPAVTLHGARRLWQWDVAPHGISLSDVAIHGSPGRRSKISAEVAEIYLTDAIELIPVTDTAATQLANAPVAKP